MGSRRVFVFRGWARARLERLFSFVKSHGSIEKCSTILASNVTERWQIGKRTQSEVVEKIGGSAVLDRVTDCSKTGYRFYQGPGMELGQHARGIYSPDFLNLRPGDGLLVGNDGQGFQRG